ncbi:Ferric-pseudobactin 358 receptor [Zhongshania aliphaticivorans]|uniref:Ferric-pseudobactin 358 receptor n=1 Tax=Zhongshania aliphaticivorans TaxID=1470434 RepID=A0A5S9MW81_9GAMM|nr:TonB-dependent receptor [Zhongshania aliphaticivorans]CAA0079777.1 Ferric-pseudobactin 358 receptor [Zhongshania aliphaticivorans]CAA0085986.1 Ferric-pseudobactin 358 receptor [Zhongshania aliphaticivorans]
MSTMIINKYVPAFVAFTCLPILLGSASLVHAQEGESKQNSRVRNVLLEEVVVTAQRREENLNDVPIAVTALNGEQLDILGVTDTRDLNIIVPGFSASEGGYGAPVYTLRGVGFPDSTYFASPTTGVYIDEVSMPYSIMSKGPNIDLARVEILKGPQGTLFGRSTTGGAINYIAQKPTQEFEAGMSASYGRFDRKDVEAYVSGPITDEFRYRFAGRYILQGDPWQYSNTDRSRELGEQDKFSLRSLFDWDISDDVSARLMLAGWRDRSDARAGQPVYFNAQNPQSELLTSVNVQNYPYIPDSDDPRAAEFCKGHSSCVDVNGKPYDFTQNETFYQAALRLSWFVTETIESILLVSYNNFEADGTEIPASSYSERHIETTLFSEIENLDVEFRLQGSGELFSSPVTWMVGLHATPHETGTDYRLFGASDNNSVFYVVPLVGALPGLDDISVLGSYYIGDGEMEYQSQSAFGNVEWQFTDTLKVTAGARYTDEERDFNGCLADDERDNNTNVNLVFTALSVQRALLALTTPDVTTPGECITLTEDGQFDRFTDTLEENSLSWRVVGDWTPNDNVLMYLSRSRGFKSGSFPVTNTTDQGQYVPARQEQVEAYEIGAKLNFFDRRLQVNTAAFYYDYIDKQLFSRIQDFLFGSLPQLQNAPSSEVTGFELELSGSPFSGLYLSAAGAYIKTEVKEFPNAFNTRGEPVDLTGAEFNYSPKLTYTFLADYSFPIGDAYEMGAGVDYSYKDETNSTLDGDPYFAHDDFGITNARLRFGRSDAKWMLTLYGRNVFNEYATTGHVQVVSDIVTRYVSDPRTYGITFDYKYD